MNATEMLERSKIPEPTGYSHIGCRDLKDPLVKLDPIGKIMIAPIWTVAEDLEGEMYADYIAEHPAYDGIYLRTGVLERLEAAANSLSDQYALVVRAGHRPLAVQKRLFDKCVNDYRANHPGITQAEAVQHVRVFVSDPGIKQPPHCCGAAVDVELFDTAAGKPVDFGGQMNVNDDISYLHYDGITDEQKAKRMLLLETMLGQGMASLASEWWHFSYGDQVWAWFYDQSDALYGTIDK